MAPAPVTTTARWFGPAERPLLGWWSRRDDAVGATAIVILPPIGYEYFSTHRTLRTLAERLAARGHGVLRVDYDGLGDSAGGRWDPGRVAAWRKTVVHAAEAVRGLGAKRLILVGLRMGATMALLEAAAVGADTVVAWVPVTSGKRFMKELKMLGLAVPADAAHPERADAVVYAGTVFSAETAAALGQIDLDKLGERPTARALIVARPDRPNDKLAARLRELGTEVQLDSLEGSETALDIPAEGATVPHAILDHIAAWIGDAPDVAPAPMPAPAARATVPWGDGEVIEEVVTVATTPPMIGVLGRPAPGTPAREMTVVWLNSGAEPHIGPGRAWVEYTRELNLRGYATMRLDFTSWGESADRGPEPGRPYDPSCLEDAIAVPTALKRAGHQRVALAGLCSGAWIGMRAALTADLDAVLAINPQLYWFPGCPVDARMADAIARREPDRQKEAKGARWHLWSALDVLGVTTYGGRWLSQLARGKVPILMLFAEGDDGLGFLRIRLGRRLRRVLRSSVLRLVEVPNIDHQMYHEWRRHDVVAALVAYLDELTGAAATAGAGAARAAKGA